MDETDGNVVDEGSLRQDLIVDRESRVVWLVAST